MYSHKKIILASLTAALLLLSFPPFNWYICAFFAFVPLFYCLRRATVHEALGLSYTTGLLFFSGSIYWLTYVSVFGYFFLVAYFSLFFALFGWCVRQGMRHDFWKRHPLASSLLLAFAWTGIEVLRARMPVFGFGWLLLGFSQVYNPFVLQIADVIGGYGVSWIVMLANFFCVITCVSWRRERKAAITYAVLCIALLMFIFSYGYFRLHESVQGVPVRIGVVQGNIAQADKWNPRLKDTIIDQYAKLIEFLSYDAPDLMVLPEAAYPGDFVREYPGSQWQKVIQKTAIPVLVGAIRLENYDEEYNSAMLLDAGSNIRAWYDKTMLVPFGEYIPCEPFFAVFGLDKLAYSLGVGAFNRGESLMPFSYVFNEHMQPVRFSSLICFEDVFPHLARTCVKNGAQFLTVITNDAWFGDTTAPYQHLLASIMRAVENNCYVVRAANTGISAYISPRGKVLDTVKDAAGKEAFVTGGVARTIYLSSRKTIFQMGGYLFEYVAFLIMCLYVAFFIVRRKAPKPNQVM